MASPLGASPVPATGAVPVQAPARTTAATPRADANRRVDLRGNMGERLLCWTWVGGAGPASRHRGARRCLRIVTPSPEFPSLERSGSAHRESCSLEQMTQVTVQMCHARGAPLTG